MFGRCQKILLALALAFSFPAAAEIGDPVRVRDAYYGEVLFHFYQGDYFNAIVHLSAAASAERLPHHDEEAELLRGGMYLSWGQHDEAARIFDALLATNANPSIRDRTWFFLAKIRYQRGYPVAAERALDQIGEALPSELEAEKRMLLAQVYIEQQRFDDAISLLHGWDGPPGWIDYARFNLGVALVRAGEFGEGAALLEKVGQLKDERSEMLGLKDKANVALGFSLLQNDGAARAHSVLQRVRLNGAFSNKALLGVGWADADRDNFRAALTPWSELIGRDPLDPAVQEAMLAVPYAMGRLDAVRQAAQKYEAAIVTFGEEQARLSAAVASIEAGDMLDRLLASDERDVQMGWYWRLDEMPDATESRYLYHLMASHRFQEALKNYRDLIYLRENLTQWQERIDTYSDILATRTRGYTERLPRVEASLANTDVAALRAEHARLSGQLAAVKAAQNMQALATKNEKRLWQEIEAAQAHPALAVDSPLTAEPRAKLRLLSGVMQWQAEKDFDARVWRQQKALHDIERILVAVDRHYLAVDDARISEPQALVDFDTRVSGATPRITSLIARTDLVLERERSFLQSLAIEELDAQSARLQTYTVQARFALAAVYDRATASRVGADAP